MATNSESSSTLDASVPTTIRSYDGNGVESDALIYNVSVGQAPLVIDPTNLPGGSETINFDIANFVAEGIGGYVVDPTNGTILDNLSLQFGQGTASLLATSPSTGATSTVATVNDVATVLTDGQWIPEDGPLSISDLATSSGLPIDTGPRILVDQTGGVTADPALSLSGEVAHAFFTENFNFADGEVVNIADNGVQVGTATIYSVNEPGSQRYVGANDTAWDAAIDLTPGDNAITITTTDVNGLTDSASLDYTYTPPAAGGGTGSGSGSGSSTGSGASGSSGSASGSGVTPPASTDAVSIDPNVTFLGRGVFALTGTVASTASVGQVELSALVEGVETDLGAATVNPNGTFTFKDHVDAHLQGFITATLTDTAGQTATAGANFDLQAGLGGNPFAAVQDVYDPATGRVGSIDEFHPDGSRVVEVKEAGQTLTSNAFDTFLNGGIPDTTFVFQPGHGLDIVSLMRAAGPGHDTISLPASDFTSIADILAHTQQTSSGAVIHDPTTGDTVQLSGVSKTELAHNKGDFALHA